MNKFDLFRGNALYMLHTTTNTHRRVHWLLSLVRAGKLARVESPPRENFRRGKVFFLLPAKRSFEWCFGENDGKEKGVGGVPNPSFQHCFVTHIAWCWKTTTCMCVPLVNWWVESVFSYICWFTPAPPIQICHPLPEEFSTPICVEHVCILICLFST